MQSAGTTFSCWQSALSTRKWHIKKSGILVAASCLKFARKRCYWYRIFRIDGVVDRYLLTGQDGTDIAVSIRVFSAIVLAFFMTTIFLKNLLL